MTIDDNFSDEKLQYDINIVAVLLLSGTVERYEYLESENILLHIRKA